MLLVIYLICVYISVCVGNCSMLLVSELVVSLWLLSVVSVLSEFMFSDVGCVLRLNVVNIVLLFRVWVNVSNGLGVLIKWMLF